MKSTTCSLKSLLGLVTVAGICTFGFLRYQVEKFESTIWNGDLYSSEIHSAQISFDDDTPSYKLSRRDAIKLVGIVDDCPLREFDECPTTRLPFPGPFITYVDLTDSKKRMLGFSLMGDCIHTGEHLVDISSSRDEITAILWHTE